MQEGKPIGAFVHQEPLPLVLYVHQVVRNRGGVLVGSEGVLVQHGQATAAFVRPTPVGIPGGIPLDRVQHRGLVGAS